MKKKLLCFLSALCLTSAPVSMTSCSEDDINTALSILDMFLSSDNLAGEWVVSDNSFEFYFNQGSGLYIYLDDQNEMVQEQFSYTTDGNSNTLTIRFSDGTTMVFTVVTLNETTLVLQDTSTGDRYTFYKYTGE